MALRVVGFLAVGFALGGCVSVFEGTSQDIVVNTTPSGAQCEFTRQGQNIGSISNTPGTLTVRKSKHDLLITCNKDGYQEAAYVNNSGLSGAVAAGIAVDVLLTAGVSSIVDSATGADNKYESVVNIMLPPKDGGTSGIAAADASDAPNAEMAPIPDRQ